MKKHKITSILVFRNGNIAAFDENDEQVSDLQMWDIKELIRDKAKQLYFDAKDTEIKFQWDYNA